MRRVLLEIASRRTTLAGHPFIVQLAADLPLEQIVTFVPQAAFFILGFQDLMKIIGEQAGAPPLGDILRGHCAEEVGHDRWYRADLVRLSGAAPDMGALFGPAHAPTRRAVYGLAAEVLAARDDVERVSLILMMEAASDVCASAAGAYFTRRGVGKDLSYFGGAHAESEREHAVFDAPGQTFVADISLDEPAFERARAVVNRSALAFSGMLDGLASTIAAAATTPART